MSLLDALIGPPRNDDPILQSQTAEAQEKGEVEPQATTPEVLALSILAEIQPDEVGKILGIWEKVFGMSLDRERVAKHLEGLRQWQSRWRKDERAE